MGYLSKEEMVCISFYGKLPVASKELDEMVYRIKSAVRF
jgi:hypothetical protein